MNVYKVRNRGEKDYDYYEEAVVVAESKEAARLVHPSLAVWFEDTSEWRYMNAEGNVMHEMIFIANNEWGTPADIEVVFVSTFDGKKEDFKFFPVICASFVGS